ncbi:MAG: hypothetical protein R6U44_01320 [Archaeoglobaceae archaeon]
MGIVINELRAYYDSIRRLNEDGFIRTEAGYLLSFLTDSTGTAGVYLVTDDVRVFMRFKERFFREELHVLNRDGKVPRNYRELDSAPTNVLEKMKEIDFELAVALGLLR